MRLDVLVDHLVVKVTERQYKYISSKIAAYRPRCIVAIIGAYNDLYTATRYHVGLYLIHCFRYLGLLGC